LNATDGAPRWHHPTGAPLTASPAVGSGTVYISSSDHYVYALRARDGAVLWRYRTAQYAVTPDPASNIVDIVRHSAPIVAPGVVYVDADGDSVYALDTEHGALRWRYQIGGVLASTPAVAGGIMFIGADDHFVYAFDI
jgi:eukaryotic-like serine/threonine-protein kinase